MRKQLGVLGGLLGAMVATAPISAQDSDLTISGTFGGVSDVRDRGLSLSGRDAAPVLGLTLDHASGFYAGAQGAFELETPLGSNSQVEFYAGYAFAAGAYVVDLSAELDTFYGGFNGTEEYPEFKANISRDFGLAYVRTGLSYAPDGRWSHPDGDSLYFRADLEIPVPALPAATIITRYGKDFREGRANVADWAAGVSYFIGDFELSLMWEDSVQDGALGRGRLVGGLRMFF